jgi:hypothetical protein
MMLIVIVVEVMIRRTESVVALKAYYVLAIGGLSVKLFNLS